MITILKGLNRRQRWTIFLTAGGLLVIPTLTWTALGQRGSVLNPLEHGAIGLVIWVVAFVALLKVASKNRGAVPREFENLDAEEF